MKRLEEIVRELAPLGRLFDEAGHSLYLVGGVVRDGLLGTLPPAGDPHAGDIDLTTDARPEAILSIVRPLASELWTQGERFGTIGATVDERPLEITTHRAESYDESSRKPVVTFGNDLETDLSRRDFTINSMAADVQSGRLVDPYGGATDLEQRLLRTPLDPRVSFGDDPLRMMRAARFIPRFDLAVDPDLVAAATELAARLSIVSVERVHDELERLLGVDNPEPGFAFTIETGLLPLVLGVDVDDSVLSQAARWSGTGRSPLERRSRLLGRLGREAAATMLGRLRYSTTDRRATLAQLDLAARFARDPIAVSTVRRAADASLVSGAHARSAVLESALGLLDLEGESTHRVTAFSDLLASLMLDEDIASFDGPLDGSELMRRLELSPGPRVGQAVAFQRELRYERGPITADEAVLALAAWLETHPDS